MAKKQAAASIYSVHPSVQMIHKWIVEMPAKTGRSLEEWIDLVKSEGPDNEKDARVWLKEVHGHGTNAAWWIAERALSNGWMEDGDPEGPFGAKEVGQGPLLPVMPAVANALYDALGVRVDQVPITPELVLRALKDGRAGPDAFPDLRIDETMRVKTEAEGGDGRPDEPWRKKKEIVKS